jgi:hypothetical protein
MGPETQIMGEQWLYHHMTLDQLPPHSGPQAGMFYDTDILNHSLCADGPGLAMLGEECGQLGKKTGCTSSWAAI